MSLINEIAALGMIIFLFAVFMYMALIGPMLYMAQRDREREEQDD